MGTSCAQRLLLSLSLFVLIQSLQALDAIYGPGELEVAKLNVSQGKDEKKCLKVAPSPSPAGEKPPRPLLVRLPKQSGTYPVVHLQHGYSLSNGFYTQLMEHVASYGYIVIAPQMPQITGRDATNEIAMGAATLNWYPNNLAAVIAEFLPNLNIIPDLSKVVLLGHSRGGKVAFGLATGVCKTSVQFSAIAGFDPVDGTRPGKQTKPKILPNTQYGLNLPFPTLVVGAGLGPEKKLVLPACAPLGLSHAAFFFDSAPLAYHFVAPAYGHMDYLNDKLSGPEGVTADNLCKNGPSRAPMRTFSGGILVAFMDAVLFGNTDALSRALLNIPSAAPLELQTPEVTKNVSMASLEIMSVNLSAVSSRRRQA